ncbi:MAG: hypothetical protein H0V66_01205, partial [Bdellovibrionales bacterium]|nr:hypothetical protein [Bdellovibrionales bacterium]
MISKLFLILFLGLSFNVLAETDDYFQKNTQEIGISNIGLGYSSTGGFALEAGVRYQYFVADKIALGGTAFYNHYESGEWMGIGPTGSYIFWTHQNFFARLDQHVIAANYSGITPEPSSFYGISSLSINYLPTDSNFFIGAGYAHSYAFDKRDVLRPNT